MTPRILCCLFLIAFRLSAVEPGQPFPPLSGEFLTGREALLPAAAGGRPALLAIGFTYKSRFAVEEWVKHFRAEFGADARATFFEVPMLGGMARMGKWFIESGMRRGTPKADHEHVITVYNNTGEWKRRLGYQEPDAAYLLLLDKSGVVVWRHTGGYDAARYAELAARLRALLTP